MGRKSPDQQLEEFLEKQPAWLRKALRGDFPATPVEASAYARYGLDRFLELLQRYEALACCVPAEWREYRRRRKQNALSSIPKGDPGRPRKDLLADEAMELKSRGKSYAQIVRELKRRHPQETMTAEAIRKLIASRRPHSGPEKK